MLIKAETIHQSWRGSGHQSYAMRADDPKASRSTKSQLPGVKPFFFFSLLLDIRTKALRWRKGSTGYSSSWLYPGVPCYRYESSRWPAGCRNLIVLAIATSTNNSQRFLVTHCAIVPGMHQWLFQQAKAQPISCIPWVTGRCFNTVSAFPHAAQKLPMSFAASMTPFRQCKFSLCSTKAGNQSNEVSSFLSPRCSCRPLSNWRDHRREKAGGLLSCRTGCSPHPGIC